VIAEAGLTTPVLCFGIPDEFIEQGTQAEIYEMLGLTPEAVEALAQGRIWMGTQAAQNGLVDKLGDLNDAVKLARQVAGLKTNEPIRIYDVEADAMTSMLSGLMGEAMLKVFAQLPISDFLQLRDIPIREADAALLSSGRTLAWSPAGLDL